MALLLTKENAPKWRKRLDNWNIIEPVALPDGSFYLDEDIFKRAPKLRTMVNEVEAVKGEAVLAKEPIVEVRR